VRVAVAEIDRESGLPAEGDDGGVVDLEEVERGRRPSVALAARRCYMRWKYSAVSSSPAGFDVCNCTSGGRSSSALGVVEDDLHARLDQVVRDRRVPAPQPGKTISPAGLAILNSTTPCSMLA